MLRLLFVVVTWKCGHYFLRALAPGSHLLAVLALLLRSFFLCQTQGGGGGVAGSFDSQVTCHQLVSVTDVATQGGVDIHIALLSPCQ